MMCTARSASSGPSFEQASAGRRRRSAAWSTYSRPSISPTSWIGHDVRIVEACRRAGLAAEPLLEVVVVGVVRRAAPSAPPRGRSRCRGRATPRPCRRGPATRSAGSGRKAFPPPAHDKQPVTTSVGKCPRRSDARCRDTVLNTVGGLAAGRGLLSGQSRGRGRSVRRRRWRRYRRAASPQGRCCAVPCPAPGRRFPLRCRRCRK